MRAIRQAKPGRQQAVMNAGDGLSDRIYRAFLCVLMFACPHVTEKTQDLYQITFSLFIHPSIRQHTGNNGASTSTKVSDCVLFPHDLPLILKQEYIISKIQFERRVVSAFCLSSAAMGRDWDGCECLVLFNSG